MAEENVQTEEPVEETKMVPQSEVDKLVVATKREAQEKAQREAQERYQRELAERQAQQSANQSQSSTDNSAQQSMGGMSMFDPASFKEEILGDIRSDFEERQRAEQQREQRAKAEELVREYEGKLEAGRERYDDFDEVVKEVDPGEFADVIVMANSVDGTADIMYELAKNPDKLIRVKQAVQASPRQAMRIMNDLANTIKTNRDGVENVKSANSPLPRVQPSTAGTGGGKMDSVADFKKASWLKG